MATIYEVAELAGVSLATVSRVMNKTTRVSDKTKTKVQAAMDELGYRPNSSAKSLASNRTDSVGVLVSQLYGPFYGPLMSGIESELRTAEIHAIIAAGHSEEAAEKDGIDFLIGRNCDALILHVEVVSDEFLIELSKGSTPIVIVNRLVPGLEENCICLDNELGGYIATKNLVEHGHTDIAYIAGPLWKDDAKERYAGHQRALSEFNVRNNPNLFFEGDFLPASGVIGMRDLFERGESFSAVVCANDEMASGAMDEVRHQGLQIPTDISVQGFDNGVLGEYMYPKLSTVDYPVFDMGTTAARWILQNVYRRRATTLKNVFQPHLIERHSVRRLPK
jgi:LacI family transcriptional regulator